MKKTILFCWLTIVRGRMDSEGRHCIFCFPVAQADKAFITPLSETASA